MSFQRVAGGVRNYPRGAIEAGRTLSSNRGCCCLEHTEVDYTDPLHERSRPVNSSLVLEHVFLYIDKGELAGVPFRAPYVVHEGFDDKVGIRNGEGQGRADKTLWY